MHNKRLSANTSKWTSWCLLFSIPTNFRHNDLATGWLQSRTAQSGGLCTVIVGKETWIQLPTEQLWNKIWSGMKRVYTRERRTSFNPREKRARPGNVKKCWLNLWLKSGIAMPVKNLHPSHSRKSKGLGPVHHHRILCQSHTDTSEIPRRKNFLTV